MQSIISYYKAEIFRILDVPSIKESTFFKESTFSRIMFFFIGIVNQIHPVSTMPLGGGK